MTMRRALLSAGLLSVAAAAVWSDGAQARTFVATSGGTDLEVKPRNWTSAGVGSGAYMEDLAWRRWGSRVARATGTAA